MRRNRNTIENASTKTKVYDRKSFLLKAAVMLLSFFGLISKSGRGQSGIAKGTKILLTPYFLDRYNSSYAAIKQRGWDENLIKDAKGDFFQIMTELNVKIAGFVSQSIAEHILPISITGDCCKSCGVLKGLNEMGIYPTIVWLDAHGDFNTHKTSPSGFIGGMALAILTGHEEVKLLSDLGLTPADESKIIAYDLRNLDPEESKLMRASRIRQPSSIAQLIDLCSQSTSIYLHIDADVINPHDAPAMLYPATGGPSIKDMKIIIDALKNRIVAASLTVWEPSKDVNQKTEAAVLSLLTSLTGS